MVAMPAAAAAHKQINKAAMIERKEGREGGMIKKRNITTKNKNRRKRKRKRKRKNSKAYQLWDRTLSQSYRGQGKASKQHAWLMSVAMAANACTCM